MDKLDTIIIIRGQYLTSNIGLEWKVHVHYLQQNAVEIITYPIQNIVLRK